MLILQYCESKTILNKTARVKYTAVFKDSQYIFPPSNSEPPTLPQIMNTNLFLYILTSIVYYCAFAFLLTWKANGFPILFSCGTFLQMKYSTDVQYPKHLIAWQRCVNGEWRTWNPPARFRLLPAHSLAFKTFAYPFSFIRYLSYLAPY